MIFIKSRREKSKGESRHKPVTELIVSMAMSTLIFVGTSHTAVQAQAVPAMPSQKLSVPFNGLLNDGSLNAAANAAVRNAASDSDSYECENQSSEPQHKIGTHRFAPWSLPVNGQLRKVSASVLRTAFRAVNLPPPSEQLEASITLSDQRSVVGRCLDRLLDAALDHDEKTKVLDKAVAHFNTTTQKVVAETKDACDYLIPYRGFGVSSEAGDIILDEKVKLKSKASAEYARQKQIDEKHVQIISNMSQIAMGLGMSDKERGSAVTASGLKALKELVGDEEAQKTLTTLSTWSKELSIPEAVYSQGVWDVHQRQDKLKFVMEAALDLDPVVQEVQRRLHKYNHRSKFAMVSSHIVETTLGAASLTPSFVGPAAKVALLAFVMATGGPESCKLMKELYLDKRFESRWKVVDQEAHLVLDNYHVAILTRNPTLLAFSESLVGEMAGSQSVPKVLGTTILAWQPQAASGMGISTDTADQDTTATTASTTKAIVQSSGAVTQ